MPYDVLPENKEVLFSLCSKTLFGGLEQRLSQRGSFLSLDYVLPTAASFKISVVKRSPLRGLFILITFLLTVVTEIRLIHAEQMSL